MTPQPSKPIPEHSPESAEGRLLGLLKTHYADQAQLLIDLLENNLLGLDPLTLLVDGISFSIEENDPELSKKITRFTKELQAIINARPKKSPDPELSKKITRFTEELQAIINARPKKSPDPKPEKKIVEPIDETRKNLEGVLEPQSGIVWQGTVKIDYNRSWQEFVDAGHYNSINPEFTEARFPLNEEGERMEGVIERELVVLEMKGNSTTRQVLREMSRLGLSAGKTVDLLAFAEGESKFDRRIPIVLLGSSAPYSYGGTVVPVLYGFDAACELHLNYYDGPWPDGYRFLARRK